MLTIKNKDLTTLMISNLDQLLECEIDGVIGFELAKVAREVKTLNDVLRDSLVKLGQKHIKKDPKGNLVKSKDNPGAYEIKDPVKYTEEYEELMEYANKLKDYEKFSISKLGLGKIKPKTLIGLDWLLDN